MPAQEILLASVLVVLAAALVAYRFLRARPFLDGGPLPGSTLARYGDIRLRDLYRLAVTLEEEGAALYLKLAELAQDPDARKLCVRLAEEEGKHRTFFQNKLKEWRPLPPNHLTWPKFLEQVKMEGLFADPPGPDATEKDIAAFAIAQERRSVKFYGMFETAFPEAWRRDELRAMVEAEISHEAKLRSTYPGIA